MPIAIGQRRQTRSVETRDFKTDDVITVDLPLGYDLNSVIVKLSGTVTIGTGPTTYHEYMVPRLIDRLDVFADGKNKYAEITGLVACLGNFERSLARQLTDLAAGTGVKTVEAYFRIDMDNADGPRPKDSSLHTNRPFMTKLQLKISTNNFNDMVKTLGSFAVSSNTLKIEVMVEETIERDANAYFEDKLVKTRSLVQETVDATKSQHKVKLPTGELMTRGVLLVSFDETGALSNAIINSVQLKSGVDVAYSKGFSDTREFNNASYRLNGTQLPTGFAYVDLCPNGNLNQLWDTRGLSELELIMDVTKPAGGDGSVVVIPVQFWEQNNAGLRGAA